MDGQDVVLAQGPVAAWIDADPAANPGRIAGDLAAVLRAERARFAPRSGHPVAMMLDEWVARLEAYAARPLLPVPD